MNQHQGFAFGVKIPFEEKYGHDTAIGIVLVLLFVCWQATSGCTNAQGRTGLDDDRVSIRAHQKTDFNKCYELMEKTPRE